MCGICGVLRYEGPLGALEREGVLRMTRALAHRGPDGEGAHEDGPVLLGHRRLAIIDLSEAARQPLLNETGDVALTFNGEIYDFVELRRELRAAGHVFRSRTDAEVVVHGYEAWGMEGLLSRLRGMFAFALWDSRKRKLFLARDRFGIKPLYYARTGGAFVFASELSGLGASGLVPLEVSESALSAFLALGSVPSPWTALRGITSLPPAHFLEVGSGGERLVRYWKLPVSERGGVEEDVRRLFREAVETHLVSDVPLGAFLSGGIDSTSLVAVASRVLDEPLTTISIVLDDAELDESVFARSVAERYRTRHREIHIGSSEFLDALPEFWECMDQPTVDGVNSYLVSRAAKGAGITVVLTGLGGDEVFLGYPHFRKIRALAPLASLVGPPLAGFRRFQPRLEHLREPTPSNVYTTFRGLFAPFEVEELLPGTRPAPLAAESEDFLDAAVELEFGHYLHNQLLRDTDSMSMAHGIEARVPFLDHFLVEAVVRLPYRTKLSRRINKPLLLRSLDEPLPREVWDRPKQGFTLPFRRFLLEHRDELTARTLDADVFHQPSVRKLWRRFLEGRVHWSRPWALVAYSEWHRRFRDRVRTAHLIMEPAASRRG